MVDPRELALSWGYQVVATRPGSVTSIRLRGVLWVDADADPETQSAQVASDLARIAFASAGVPHPSDVAVATVAMYLLEPMLIASRRAIRRELPATAAQK